MIDKNRLIKSFLLLFLVLCLGFSYAEPIEKDSIGIKPSDTESRIKSYEAHMKLKQDSIFRGLQWRNVGPQFQGGRISDIAVPKGKPYTIYVSAGAGNLWKTENNGTTWKPIFDNESTFAIGDIAISESNPEVIWVGSGEDLMARSSYAGTGIFKSPNGGKTWENMGLQDTQHIGRIIIHPKNPDIVYVAAMGHMYSYNKERGLFKTEDGGTTWENTLFINEKVGAVEVVMDPSDYNTLFAATWERDRKAWDNVECGEGSGIYKSTDAGATWKKLTNGFPDGKYVGRIGLSVSVSNPNVIYALLDNQEPKPFTKKNKKDKKESGLKIVDLERMSVNDFLKIDQKIMENFLRINRVPREYTAEKIFKMVREDELTPKILGKYLLDAYADRKLHETNVKGGEVYRSDDKGETWKKVNKHYFDTFFSTYGYSFCDICVSPDNEDHIYILGIRMLASKDGGQTYWHMGGKKNVHVDHHALWVDPINPNHLIIGNDGGLNFSYDRGETWEKINNISIAEFYAISVDKALPYNIYGGTQDNGSLYGPSDHSPEHGVPDPWQHLGGGDGFFVFADPSDKHTVYLEYQFGGILRKDLPTGNTKNIMPSTKIGEPAIRCNWMTPFIISQHNHLTLYFGANKLFKSLNRGDKWTCISPDLTTNPGPEKQGDVTYGSITTISESPHEPGLIYVGTDDGNIHITHNDGVSWGKISHGLPKCWVTRIIASKYDKKTVYASFSAYRQDNFEAWLYRSSDFGKTWESIYSNLPAESINVIREDHKKEQILYLGTDLGIYISTDRGGSWSSLCNNLPSTPIHDLVIHPKEDELVIGTHGRGAYILDIRPIHQIKAFEKKEKCKIFKVRPVSLPRYRGNGEWALEKIKKANIYFYLEKPQKLSISILDKSSKLIRKLQSTNHKGINIVKWDLTFEGGKELGHGFGSSGKYVKPGDYIVEFQVGKQKIKSKIEVRY